MHSPFRLLLGTLAVFGIGIVTGNAIAQRSARSSFFSDVEVGTEAGDAISRYASLGMMQGYGNGLFGPQDEITRAQAAILFARIEDRLIAPLREQVEELRKALDLGSCGDGMVQTGEECDDQNNFDDDGCSHACLHEIFFNEGCPGGYKIGEGFPSPDGCNSCVCTSSGPACTKMFCPPPEPEPIPEPEPTPEPEPEPQSPPLCGNGICELYENVLPPHRRFHCPEDCTGAEPQHECAAKKQTLLQLNAEDTKCGSTADCIMVRQSCPHITCGIAVNKSNYPSFVLAMDDTLETCRREGSTPQCVLCSYNAAVCENGQCIVKKERE
ncbi:MAG TPA: S-layer homology domain-containing protein [Candidatus Peribacterales bacterium]|nr:S-layer homology domain-containing protein [Candidatus Peribacterales bacterium]